MKHISQKHLIRGLLLVATALVLGILLYALLTGGKGGREFNRYLSDLFLEEVTSNTLNMHFTLKNPASVGISSYEVTLGDFSESARKKEARKLREIKSKLGKFSYRSLSEEERLTYKVLEDFLNRQIRLSDYDLYEEVLTPSGGVTTQLPVLLAEYRFHSKRDVEDYIALLSQMDTYYSQIMEFEQKKADAGLFMSDDACQRVIEGCEVFTDHPDDNFLFTTFENRLADVEELTPSDIEELTARHKTIVAEHVIPAYQNVISKLTGLMGSGKNDWGLCNYPDGKEYYCALAAFYTGCDDSPEKLAEQIEKKRTEDLIACQEILKKSPELLQESDTADIHLKDTDLKDIDLEDKETMLKHLEKEIQKEFPDAPATEYEIHDVDSSLKDYLAPAFYITAPIDDYKDNHIYINNAGDYDNLYLFTTLAHEGFPGHLYQTVQSCRYGMSPMHALLDFPGFTEGWATYAEMLSYYYTGLAPDLASLLQHNQAAMLSLYATSDIGIHYYGWEKKDMLSFWKEHGISDEATVDAITRLILDEPGNYLKYYVGYLKFSQLRSARMAQDKDKFDPVKFHEEILRIGPAPFELLEKKLLK